MSVNLSLNQLKQAALETLEIQVEGNVLLPGSDSYDEARKAWNLTVDQHPALIVMAKSAADIAYAVRFASDQGLTIAVQSTGHGVGRNADDCVLIVTSQMDDVQVDAKTYTAKISAGVLWSAVLEKAQAVGLAPLLGSSSGIGAIGYTSGGGLGWLARKYGYAADSVVSFNVVTADGRILRTSRTENSDLFWGLCGAGGGLAIITSMEIRLYPVTTVYGGSLIYPAALARDVLLHYRDWIKTLPEEFTTTVAMLNFPPLPFVPEELRGKSVIMVRGCYCGPVEAGEAQLDYWRQWKAPMIDGFHAMPFSQVDSISQDPIQPTPALHGGRLLRELDDATIDVFVRYALPSEANQGRPGIVSAEIRHVAGAKGRVPGDANALGHRDAPFFFELIGMAFNPEMGQAVEGYIAQFRAALDPRVLVGALWNILGGEEKWGLTSEIFAPDTLARLRTVKAKYDPHNQLRFSINIPPAE